MFKPGVVGCQPSEPVISLVQPQPINFLEVAEPWTKNTLGSVVLIIQCSRVVWVGDHIMNVVKSIDSMGVLVLMV